MFIYETIFIINRRLSLLTDHVLNDDDERKLKLTKVFFPFFPNDANLTTFTPDSYEIFRNSREKFLYDFSSTADRFSWV